MAARGRRRPKGPATLEDLMARYLTWRTSSGSAPATVAQYAKQLRLFLDWSHEHGVTRPLEVSETAMERYQRAVAAERRDGRAPSLALQCKRLSAVSKFFGWLVRQHEVPCNPAGELVLPRPALRLPRGALTSAEVERVLAQADVACPLGLRDRAMMEVLYSTGLRRQELSGLCLQDVDPERGTVLVREGKGRKDRVVPIGQRALEWVRRYLEAVRPGLLVQPDDGRLFLGALGRGLRPKEISKVVRRRMRGALPGRRTGCHLFRHAMATLMMENGADVRYVQAQLGHASLATTEIYTHVTLSKLREIHAATHPAEVGLLKRPGA